MRHAVIMAGGSGTRLWPLSRKLRPKQLLRLFDGASLLQLARRRLEGLFAPEHIWVITSAHYLDQVAAELPDVPRDNLIGEPLGRDTANAIGLAANLLARRDSDATMAVFTADHIITPPNRFAAAIRTGLETAEAHPDSLVTFGVTPRSPHTGYGYLRRGRPCSVGPQRPTALSTAQEQWHARVFEVAEFKEKPTHEVAEQYLRSGEYYWNSGMFAWRVSAILAELERQLPDNARGLAEIAADWEQRAGAPPLDSASDTEVRRDRPELARRFEQLRKISIDFGVMEHAGHVLLVEMDCEWKDLGSWLAVAGTRRPDAAGNVAVASRSLVLDGRDNVIVTESGHLIVVLGASNLVVVHSADATLVCRKDQVERIKDVVGRVGGLFGAEFE